jgi:hypothetical protein
MEESHIELNLVTRAEKDNLKFHECELTSRMLSENLLSLFMRALGIDFQFEEADE